MKSFIKVFFGLLAIMLVLSFAGCDNNPPPPSNNFIGDWKGVFNIPNVGEVELISTTTADSWSITSEHINWNGTYTLTSSTTAIFKNDNGTEIGTAVLSNNNNTLTVTITEVGGTLSEGTTVVVNKFPYSGPNNFIGNWNGTFDIPGVGEVELTSTVTADSWSITNTQYNINWNGTYTLTSSTTAIFNNDNDTEIGTSVLSSNNNTLTVTITEAEGTLSQGTEIVVTRN